ncbi:L,D-transpeptidase [Ruminiclostridium cellobioparum]|jgi:hypothetical protein|uniref:L,D-transpeptidase n=1 Tax=Ruminiclostridium cellobioparum TaxID=29355 RepID=UPI0003464D62|nr:L,D-transpeptidase [Ruminiclostridium cellobioparum]
MGKRILCIVTLSLSLILQSSAVSFAENYAVPGGNSSEAIVSAAAQEQQNQLSEEEIQRQLEQLREDQEQLKKDQEQLFNDQEQLKYGQEQLVKDREQLNKDQAQLKYEQEKLKNDQEQLKKEREKLEGQDKRKKLNTELTSNTYLKYIKELGYYKATSKDETLNIRNAVLLFQSDHNMSITGVWDNATKDMLINRLVSNVFSYADNITNAPANGKWIVVNKTKRTLTLYEGKKVIKKYPVAVGNPHTLTKSGKFMINNKIIDPDWGGGGFAAPVKGGTPENPLGSRWLGINRTDGSYGIHGTNSFYSIGKFISHGCIRMQNYCVEELFPLVPMKAPVWVGTEAELKAWGVTQNAFTAN